MELSYKATRPSLCALLGLIGTSFCAPCLIVGCASPGVPKPPSLHVPAPVLDLTATRIGNTVELHFTVPQRATDDLPLKMATLTGTACREIERSGCVPVAGLQNVTINTLDATGAASGIVWRDTLPPELLTGTPRLLGYRVEFLSAKGRSGGKSDAAYAASGAAPSQVVGLHADGSRAGIVLGWVGGPQGDVLLRRKDLNAKPPVAKPTAARSSVSLGGPRRPKPAETPGELWLEADATDVDGKMLDASAIPDEPYRYVAVRRQTVQVGARSLELRSVESIPVETTLREIYPPAAPVGLNAAGYASLMGFAVDLIWQPLMDAKVVGYNVYRSPSDATGEVDKRTLMGTVIQPAFHDTTARAGMGYVYRVTAVDEKGNESAAASVVVPPQ